MMSVDARSEVVESELRGGGMACPLCAGELRPWGSGRPRRLRDGLGWLTFCPRRSRCRVCRATHVLLPVVALLRRLDLAEVIGRALQAKAGARRV